jgi:hypothetical protein
MRYGLFYYNNVDNRSDTMTEITPEPAERMVSVRINSGVHNRIKSLAEATNRSTHYLLKNAIESYTSLHVTEEDADE